MSELRLLESNSLAAVGLSAKLGIDPVDVDFVSFLSGRVSLFGDNNTGVAGRAVGEGMRGIGDAELGGTGEIEGEAGGEFSVAFDTVAFKRLATITARCL